MVWEWFKHIHLLCTLFYYYYISFTSGHLAIDSRVWGPLLISWSIRHPVSNLQAHFFQCEDMYVFLSPPSTHRWVVGMFQALNKWKSNGHSLFPIHYSLKFPFPDLTSSLFHGFYLNPYFLFSLIFFVSDPY